MDNTKEGVQNITFSTSELNWYHWLDIPGTGTKADNNNTAAKKAPDTGDVNTNAFPVAGLLGAIVFGVLAAFKMKYQ